ncbi:MAG: aminotransferase class III-fold pyridoxal phosphate-dependent enzyme [Actinomycetia bacterium]|nr:aminotransferase class III-fold pyridoxal phosphate-dependent enzyme [Actinomycetes bacterium]
MTTTVTTNALAHTALHFTPGAMWRSGAAPIWVRGEGIRIWDQDGNSFIDGLAGLFSVQIGHGRADIAAAAGEQMKTLAYMPSWSATTPVTIEASNLIASLAPGDLDVVFLVSSGSEAVESAIKFSRQYHSARNEPRRVKVISRYLSYHGTTMGALSATGLPGIREAYGPLLYGFRKVSNTLGFDDGVAAAARVEEAIIEEGPETVAMVLAEPVQNGGGSIVPPAGYWQELRRICDKYGVLLCADEVINGFGRLGEWFGSELMGVVPDLLTFAKGATSSYAPIGGLLIREPVFEELMDSHIGTFNHGATWGGHAVVAATSVANLTAMRDEDVVGNVRNLGGYFREKLERMAAGHRMVSDVRGIGFFYAVELTADRETGRRLTPEQADVLLKKTLPPLMMEEGLYTRADDRGEPKILLCPPLISTRSDIDDMVSMVDRTLDKAGAMGW